MSDASRLPPPPAPRRGRPRRRGVRPLRRRGGPRSAIPPPARPLLWGLLISLLFLASPARAELGFGEDDWLRLYGDFRFRLERDWDSRRADGSERRDRDRARVRARAGVRFVASESLGFDLRLRTGSHDGQQSPHITIEDFDGNDEGDRAAFLDRWYVRFQDGDTWAWAGRNDFPFWTQNEVFWDDDVTPAGAAAGHEWGVRKGTLALRAAYLTVPDGGVDFLGNLAAAQVVSVRTCGETDYTFALGLFVFDGEEGAENLRNGNGARDYTIGTGSFQAKWPVGGRPLSIGADVMVNVKGYDADDPDPFTAANHDETSGFVVQASWGEATKARDWLVAYYYARVEALAVNASFAGDDWVRWGSATQTDASDLQGHELRFAYGLTQRMSLMARLYLVEAISSPQDGKRFRLDLDWRL